MARTLLLWFTYIEERATYSNEQVYNATERYDYQQGISTSVGYPIKLLSKLNFDVAVKGHHNPSIHLQTNKVFSIVWGFGDTTFKSSLAGRIAVPDNVLLYWSSYVENK
ncbi:hypothetical protein ACRASX_10945 [Flavobacterium sp. TMP13]|uniref:hypothetical protein n=1 Tax=unclassified Flavobacterium TaxID=196869 RepID=UPI00076D15BD|nr:hypothetical protein [Flavobacterium sp. TAB 87]KVV14841.1 hypothetical protein AP058_01398 [Flavobacterium sp. TAB 87]